MYFFFVFGQQNTLFFFCCYFLVNFRIVLIGKKKSKNQFSYWTDHKQSRARREDPHQRCGGILSPRVVNNIIGGILTRTHTRTYTTYTCARACPPPARTEKGYRRSLRAAAVEKVRRVRRPSRLFGVPVVECTATGIGGRAGCTKSGEWGGGSGGRVAGHTHTRKMPARAQGDPGGVVVVGGVAAVAAAAAV